MHGKKFINKDIFSKKEVMSYSNKKQYWIVQLSIIQIFEKLEKFKNEIDINEKLI